MALNFPSSPVIGQQYSYSGKTWEWSGTYWKGVSIFVPSGASGQLGLSGISGISGRSGLSGISGLQGTSGLSGLSGENASPLYSILITGVQNNVNKTFTLAQPIPTGNEHMFFNNGQLLTYGSDYTITGTTLEFTTSYPAPTPTDVLKIFFGLSSIASQSGLSGLEGLSGISGLQGSNGQSGTSGLQGSNGQSGISGLQGSNGQSGISGLQGSNGQSGISGLQGSNGQSGISGLLGQSGLSGESGISGLEGISGLAGVAITPELITVSLTGGTADYTSVKTAIDSITGNSSTSPYIVYVGPGLYIEDPFNMKSFVTLRGESSISTIIQANNPNTSLIIGADQSMVQDVQIQGCTGTGVSAIVYSSSTTPQLNAIFYVENVRFGENYTHVKNIGTGGGNSIIQCSNVKYGGYPFTIGFYCTNDGSGIGRMQLRNVTSTNGGITTTSGLVFAKADQSGCGFIVNGCLLTKAVGAAAGTGFWVENGAFLRLTGVNFQRWATGIYAPQTGSAPSIDAIALNFENCTTDVNIIHSGTTGKIQGTDNFIKTVIPINAPIYEVGQDPRRITVSKKGGDFSSIKDAVDYITGSSSSNRFVIEVGPGRFEEDEIDLNGKPYVSIVGSTIQTTEVVPVSPTQHIFKIGVNNEISFLSLSGSGSGYAGIYCDDVGDFAQAHKISFYDCDINVWVLSSTQDTQFYGEYLDFNGEYSYGTKVTASNGFVAYCNMENYYQFLSGTGATIGNFVEGSGATLNLVSTVLEGNSSSGSTGILLQDSAFVDGSALDIAYWDYGIRVLNIGSSCEFELDGTSIDESVTWDLFIEQASAFGRLQGSADHSKISNVSDNVFWVFLDHADGELDITRKLSVTFDDGTHTDASTLIFQGSSMGPMSGGVITIVSGFTINTTAGFGYLQNTINPSVIQRIDWNNSQLVLSANVDEYVYINDNSVLTSSGGLPEPINNIILGRVVTNSTTVELIDQSPYNANHTPTLLSSFNRNALGPIYSDGSIVTQNLTPFQLDITQGSYYFSENNFLPSGGTGVTFTQYYYSGSGWVTSSTTFVNNSQYNANQNSLSGLTSSAYTKHTLYVIGEGIDEKYFLVLGQNEYTTLVETEDAPLPLPPTFFKDAVTPIASIYIQEGFSGITQIEDIRPVIGFKSAGVNATAFHGNLLGLANDDHTQYLLVDGARQMTGDLDLGGNDIYNVNDITADLVTTSALTINNLTQDQNQTKFVVVDNGGVTYYRTGGESGISGLQGVSGISGLEGPQGLSGISGIAGSSGLSGISGIAGSSGISGLSGISGVSGDTGNSGISGLQGISGIGGSSISTLSFTVDTGGAAPVSSGLKSFVYLPYSGTIISWTILANTTGSTELDLYKSTYVNYPPDISGTIITSDFPYLSNTIKNQSSNLTGWTTTFDADDIIGLYVKSATTITRLQLILEIQK